MGLDREGGRSARKACRLWRVVVVGLLACTVACVETIRREHGMEGPDVRPPGTPAPVATPGLTDLAFHTQARLVAGKNAVWCATSQQAWDAMADLLPGARLDLGPPAPPDEVAALNRQRFPPEAVDPATSLVVAGWASRGIQARFEQEAWRRFHLALHVDAPPRGRQDLEAYAALVTSLPFVPRFRVHERQMSFAGGPARVYTFGCLAEDTDSGGARIAANVEAHEATDGAVGDGVLPFAVVLRPAREGERVILARVRRPATLEDAWIAARDLLASEPVSFQAGDVLEVPKMDFQVGRDEEGWFGSPIRNSPIPHSYFGRVYESIELTLTEKGARLVSVATVGAGCSARGEPLPRHVFRFDGPFLLALARRGAERPYFLLWLENDDLFVRSRGPASG